MTRYKIIIINRWDDEFSEYTQYINHFLHDVTYITNKKNHSAYGAMSIIFIENFDNVDLMDLAIEQCINLMNGLDKIIAMSEFDLEYAAHLRTKYNLSGVNDQLIDLYRDKVAMKNAIAKFNIQHPKFAAINSIEDVTSFIKNNGLPVILKPRRGAASTGVIQVHSTDSISKINEMDLTDYECEQFISGEIYHIDGAINNGELLFIIPSKYINNCLDYSLGSPLGSVMIDDHVLKIRMRAFAEKILHGLKLETGIFHLECILNNQDELYFLEIGARCGGGEIPFVLNKEFGINMFNLWVKMQLGETLPSSKIVSDKITGFLLIPTPSFSSPTVIEESHSLINQIKHMTFEKSLQIGCVLNNNSDDYDRYTAKFRYTGKSTADIERAIHKTISSYTIKYTPIQSMEQ